MCILCVPNRCCIDYNIIFLTIWNNVKTKLILTIPESLFKPLLQQRLTVAFICECNFQNGTVYLLIKQIIQGSLCFILKLKCLIVFQIVNDSNAV
jgi:hypothetical protein